MTRCPLCMAEVEDLEAHNAEMKAPFDSPTPPQDATDAGEGVASLRPAEPSLVALDAAEAKATKPGYPSAIISAYIDITNTVPLNVHPAALGSPGRWSIRFGSEPFPSFYVFADEDALRRLSDAITTALGGPF